jgi:hypothetical protein
MGPRLRILVVVLLLGVNAAAVLYLQRHLESPETVSASSGGSSEDGSASPSPSTAASGESGKADPTAAPLWVLADPRGRVLRATVGSCRSENPASVVSVSTGSGSTPKVVRVRGLQRVLSLRRVPAGWEVIGANRKCRPRMWVSDGPRGRGWESSAVPDDRFHLLPENLSRVATPTGEVDLPAPCLAEQLISYQDVAYVLCDGTVLTLESDGAEIVQTRATTLPNATAVAVRPSATGEQYAWLSQAPGCTATLQRRGPGPERTVGCLAEDAAGTGLTWSGSSLVAQVGGDLVDVGRRGATTPR